MPCLHVTPFCSLVLCVSPVVVEQLVNGPVEVISLKNISDDHNMTVQPMTILPPCIHSQQSQHGIHQRHQDLLCSMPLNAAQIDTSKGTFPPHGPLSPVPMSCRIQREGRYNCIHCQWARNQQLLVGNTPTRMIRSIIFVSKSCIATCCGV